MANTRHPLDIAIDEFYTARAEMIRLFASDGHICERERFVLDLHDVPENRVQTYRTVEEAADSWKRNGYSRVTRDRFEVAGYKLVDLEAERKARPGSNVILLPNRQHAG